MSDLKTKLLETINTISLSEDFELRCLGHVHDLRNKIVALRA